MLAGMPPAVSTQLVQDTHLVASDRSEGGLAHHRQQILQARRIDPTDHWSIER
jgi:hypothetical protein